MKLPKFNQKGFTLHAILPALVILTVSVIGVRTLTASHAAPLPCTANTYASGITSHCVGDIQKMLNGFDHAYRGSSPINGSQIVVDDHFGSQTEGKVKTFQKWANLKSDGIVGSKTWADLCVYTHATYDKNSSYTVERTAFQASVDAGCTNNI